MHDKMLFRRILKKDYLALKRLLKPWCTEDPELSDCIDSVMEGQLGHVQCRILEIEKNVSGALLWSEPKPGEVIVHGAAVSGPAMDTGIDARFFREAVLEWAEMRVMRASLTAPEPVSSALISPMRAAGFMFEGLSSSWAKKDKPLVTLSKHFLYRTIPESKLMDFMREILLSLGYEVRPEDQGFGYRLKSEYRLPFIFSSWHRITRRGQDIIVHPPARLLELHELETLFYPLQIHASGEKPLLLSIDRKRAEAIIDFPPKGNQDELFGAERLLKRRFLDEDFVIGTPPASQGLRRGLPVVFWAQKIGAVGSARVEDWRWEEPDGANADQVCEPVFSELEAPAPPHHCKSLGLRFAWYKPFKRIVTFEEMKQVDEGFNPQRTRVIAPALFQAVLDAGAGDA